MDSKDNTFTIRIIDVDKIINDLISGKNSFTGEMLDNDHLLNDERIKKEESLML